jgi:hypothetical protein
MRLLLGLLIAGLIVVGRPASALACTPPPGGLPDLTAADRARAAEVVLEGTIAAVSGEYPVVATVDVARYLKGSGPSRVTISGFGQTSVCLSPVDAGQRWIFYASGDPQAGLKAFYASQFDAVAAPDPQTIAEIEAALAGPAPQPTVVRPGALPATGAPAELPALEIGLALLAALALWKVTRALRSTR